MAEPGPKQPARRGIGAFLPLGVFLALAGLFAWGMWGARVDRHESPLLGKPAPVTAIPDLLGSGQFSVADHRGKVVIVNVFASWCAPCRVEHPQLMQLAKDSRFVVLGIAYRDEPEDTVAFLDELGNPFADIGFDRQGALGVQFGLGGVPETYLIDPQGVVQHKVSGELTAQKAAELVRIAAGLAAS